MKGPLCIQVCSFFRGELAALLKEPEFKDVVMGIFPGTCGHPPLDASIPRRLGDEAGPGATSRVIGSVCLADLRAGSDNSPIAVLRHHQCFYPFADQAWVDGLIEQGVYLITPGWLIHWRQWLDSLGFASRSAVRDYFHEFAKRLVLLDTGVMAEARERMDGLAEYLDLPSESIPIGLEHFRLYISKLYLEWSRGQEAEESADGRRRLQGELANYAMAMDLVRTLARTLDEHQAINAMREVFQMLFGAESVAYLPVSGEESAHPPPPAFELQGAGFRVSIGTEKHHYGSVLVGALAFPRYRDHYLNVALVLTGVCALAIENARVHQAALDAERSLRASHKHLEHTIEDLHRTRKQLVEAEKMASLGTLVAGVAHEINTPVGVGLTATSTLAERSERLRSLFQNRTMKHSDLQGYLDITGDALSLISGNFQRIGGLVSSFKQVATDRFTERRRPFRLKSYIQDIVCSLGRRLHPDAVSVQVNCDEVFSVDSYPGVLAQILTNLLLNSMEHGFEEECTGCIEIRVEPGDHDWVLHYLDNGQGIQPRDLPRLFDPFFTTDMQDHTGLGMHILYNLVVQKLEGSVNCESEPGQGVHFTLRFPMTPQGERV